MIVSTIHNGGHMTEQQYWDGQRRLWYKDIKESGYDLQVAADTLWSGMRGMLDAALSDPRQGLVYIMHLSHIVYLTSKWVLGKRDDTHTEP
jgi:hypothetical protein